MCRPVSLLVAFWAFTIGSSTEPHCESTGARSVVQKRKTSGSSIAVEDDPVCTGGFVAVDVLNPDEFDKQQSDLSVNNDCDEPLEGKAGWCRCAANEIATPMIKEYNFFGDSFWQLKTCTEACGLQGQSRYYTPSLSVDECPSGTSIETADECLEALYELGIFNKTWTLAKTLAGQIEHVDPNNHDELIQKFKGLSTHDYVSGCSYDAKGNEGNFNDELGVKQKENKFQPLICVKSRVVVTPADTISAATPIPTPIPTPVPTPVPTKRKTCFHWRPLYRHILELAGKTIASDTPHEDLRNTCIVYNRDHSSSSTSHFQGMTNLENVGAAAAIITFKELGYSDSDLKDMSEDDQRNSLIVRAEKCSGKTIAQLQGMKTLDVVMIMNYEQCCFRIR